MMNERRYGILIASSRFPNESLLEDLRCPENDVDGMNEVLSSEALGGFDETICLKNLPHHEVLLEVNQVLRKAEKSDLILIYYSGHGKLNPANRLHLVTTNTVVSALEATSIPVDTIKNYVDISSANKVVLILDCCFSGAVGDAFARSGVDDQLQLASGGRGTYIMTASTGVQVAMERESDDHGIFTKHFIEGIRSGKADRDGDGWVTTDELYTYVHDHVLGDGFQEPMKWDLNVRGEMFIAKTGKDPRSEWRKKARAKLLDLAGQQVLPDSVLSSALGVIAKDLRELTEIERKQDELIKLFFRETIALNRFIQDWYSLSQKKEDISTPQSDVDSDIDASPDKSKGDERSIGVTVSGEARKPISRWFYIGGGVLAACIVFIMVLVNHQNTKYEEKIEEYEEVTLNDQERAASHIPPNGVYDVLEASGFDEPISQATVTFYREGNQGSLRLECLAMSGIYFYEGQYRVEGNQLAGNLTSTNDPNEVGKGFLVTMTRMGNQFVWTDSYRNTRLVLQRQEGEGY
jgi:hypothetical protein